MGKDLGDLVVPSKIRTAVGKSLTLLAALRAAVITDGEGTRSYAKALFRLRYGRAQCQMFQRMVTKNSLR